MSTRRQMVAGNWKMNGTLEMATTLVKSVNGAATSLPACDIVVCPPSVYIDKAKQLISSDNLSLGAQNAATELSGAYTGELSASMLKDVGCEYVILGHSERRQYYSETNDVVAHKAATALEAGLSVILCVGESLEVREQGETLKVVGEQLNMVIEQLGIEAFKNITIAYEPVWAIGTGKTATPEQAQEVHAFIRTLLNEHSPNIAATCRLLYGGSVKPDNAAALFAKEDIDGALVGGASLKAEDFIGICQANS